MEIDVQALSGSGFKCERNGRECRRNAGRERLKDDRTQKEGGEMRPSLLPGLLEAFVCWLICLLLAADLSTYSKFSRPYQATPSPFQPSSTR